MTAIHAQPFLAISADTHVEETLRTLVGRDVASARVVENERSVGIISDRDALEKFALQYDVENDKLVCGMMTANSRSVGEDASSATALFVMEASRNRRGPVVGAHGNVVRIGSPQPVSEFLRKQFSESN